MPNKLFLIGDAASCAKAHQKLPQGYYNVEVMLHGGAKHGAEVGVCGTCMDARGITEGELVEGTHRSTLEQLADWTQWADKALVFCFPGVYAIGDVVSIPLKLGKPLPKAGVFAHAEGDVVAKNIASAISGRPGGERFNGYGECFIEIGGGKAGFGGGDFYAEPKPLISLRFPG